ncbi:c-type cytochrome [Algoriphagus aquimarinus]|uniref:Cytochrome c n=1 Tax=Algoriphagus aquimarinus TaxID=237018 RepID=A0A1I0ZDV7_9BACT|nr:c-type cytochrome [Algoriphagus aquimarinus]SFB23711.1 cytochrome c [Algoriphagus aquimarinus]|tara:strand:+ start:90819 stop:91247 length:429 start_codon:yes stop_codon:yes gene_type:complete
MKITKPLNLALVALAGFTFACGGGDKTSETTSTPAVETPAAPEKEISLEEKYQDDPIYIKGLAKLKTSDCTSCHMVERKIVGPSYADVAAKYEATDENITMLAEKVINGGVGVWGEIPMPPHTALSMEDAKDMVSYVLLLKK